MTMTQKSDTQKSPTATHALNENLSLSSDWLVRGNKKMAHRSIDSCTSFSEGMGKANLSEVQEGWRWKSMC